MLWCCVLEDTGSSCLPLRPVCCTATLDVCSEILECALVRQWECKRQRVTWQYHGNRLGLTDPLQGHSGSPGVLDSTCRTSVSKFQEVCFVDRNLRLPSTLRVQAEGNIRHCKRSCLQSVLALGDFSNTLILSFHCSILMLDEHLWQEEVVLFEVFVCVRACVHACVCACSLSRLFEDTCFIFLTLSGLYFTP